MHVTAPGHGLVDLPQKFQELLAPLSWFAGKPLPGNGYRSMQSLVTLPDFASSASDSVVVPWHL
jgi:hypothetical protein